MIQSAATACVEWRGPKGLDALQVGGMNFRLKRRVILSGMIVLAAPALAGGASLAMLDRLEPGRWELRDRSGTVVPRVCVARGRQLVQLRHQGLACETFVVEDQPGEVVVQYTCKGRGYGRTHIRRESNRLVQIDGQGIADGLPFEFAAEARRVGECSTG